MHFRYALTFANGIRKIPGLSSLLGVRSVSMAWPIIFPASKLFTNPESNTPHIVVGWGLKNNTKTARHYAIVNNLPYLALEDGFLRSIGLGVNNSPPLSLVVDDLGVYYDAARPSRLEEILNGNSENLEDLPCSTVTTYYYGDPLESSELIQRARHCIDQIIGNKLSKYNSSPDASLGSTTRQRVLVVDQTAGDLSIRCGLANRETFTHMLETALAEFPDAEIIIKVHPDVITGKKKGHYLANYAEDRIRIIAEDMNPISLIEQVDHVYVVTSQLGFEALLAGKPVTCFGAPFYAGWGLTDDRVTLPRRRIKRTVEQIFAATYILYSRYRDPDSGEPCEIERIIDHLSQQRNWFKENSGTLYCYGFSLWKRAFVRRYLHSPWNRIRFVRSIRQIERGMPDKEARIVVWGIRETSEIHQLAEQNGIPIWRMEDGFLRSVGLGSDLVAPTSLILDKKGIYFDPSQPSDLESILKHSKFSEEERYRARTLRETIIASGLSKYNLGQTKPLAHTAKPGQRIILVPGQVESDASIKRGCPDIHTNARLLHAVRMSAPDAWIIYKPHPDVLSGNRTGSTGDEHSAWFDQLVTDISISQCLDVADEVHTMTSLVGFEGLLRGKRVVTYGRPFYAGWGLTDDRHQNEQRRRNLSLDQLVAGCLIRYPRYLNSGSGEFTIPEMAIHDLRQQHSAAKTGHFVISPTPVRLGRKLTHLLNGVLYAR